MSDPYYSDERVTLYHGDCREITEWLEADVLVTDPPYGRAIKLGSGLKNSNVQGIARKCEEMIAGDESTDVRDAILDAWGDRRAIVFGDPLIARPARARQALVYAKPFDSGIRGAYVGYRRDAELIYLTGPWEAGVGGRSSILTTGASVAGPRGLSVRYGHPHAKPVDLLEDLLTCALTNPPVAIADPFSGSGSILVAAASCGHHVIGVELEERYCEIAAKRLAQEQLLLAVAPGDGGEARDES